MLQVLKPLRMEILNLHSAHRDGLRTIPLRGREKDQRIAKRVSVIHAAEFIRDIGLVSRTFMSTGHAFFREIYII